MPPPKCLTRARMPGTPSGAPDAGWCRQWIWPGHGCMAHPHVRLMPGGAVLGGAGGVGLTRAGMPQPGWVVQPPSRGASAWYTLGRGLGRRARRGLVPPLPPALPCSLALPSSGLCPALHPALPLPCTLPCPPTCPLPPPCSAPLREPRKYHGLVAAGGRLLAVGGLTAARTRLASVEALDPREGGPWRPLAPLALPRSSGGVAALGGEVYVVGGHTGGAAGGGEVVTRSVEAYRWVGGWVWGGHCGLCWEG